MGGDFGYAGAAGGGGAALSAFRHPDFPDFEALDVGLFGDDMEYASRDDLLDVWAPVGSMPATDVVHGGSDVQFWGRGSNGRGLVKALGTTLPDDFEIGVLSSQSGHPGSGMFGIGVHNGSGGIATAFYDAMYYILLSNVYVYSGGLSGSGTPERRLPLISTLKRSGGTNWRVRYSNNDGATWTTAVSPTAITVANPDRITLVQAFSNETTPRIHKVVYGAPDLGLG